MRLSKMHIKTLREVPNEAEIPSHILLLRTGMIRKLVSGVYGFMHWAGDPLERLRTSSETKWTEVVRRRSTCPQYSLQNYGKNPADGMRTDQNNGD